MKIGITGASGMLGTELISHLSKSHQIIATSRTKSVEGRHISWSCFDLTEPASLSGWLENSKPDLVIHCAAIVNVEFCEENFDLASSLHVETTQVISDYLNRNGGRLIYISTDSVFDGEKEGSYSEADITNPTNVYAQTKLTGEAVVIEMDRGLVLRTNIIGFVKDNKTSFADWLLNALVDGSCVNLFDDVVISPLTVYDLAPIIEKIISQPIYGLYHCGSSNSISKYEFGMEMAKTFHLSSLNVNRISVEAMDFKAMRPKNLSLNVNKISTALNYDFPTVAGSIGSMKTRYDKKNTSLE